MSAAKRNPALTGIEVRHSAGCRSRLGDECSCKPTYRAEVHNPRTGRPKKSKGFKTVAEARGWKASAEIALRNGTLGSGSGRTVRQAAEDWLAMAERGDALNRSGKRYKPSVLRSYETSLRLHVLPIVGSMKLTNLKRQDLQELVDRIALDRHASTVRNAIMPLRAIFRYGLIRGVVPTNPTDGLALPAVEGTRDRVASSEEADQLLNALPLADRAVWAAAMYCGLRLGELQALQWRHIDLDQRVIRVESSWDKKAGPVEPKSRAGKRIVPIPSALLGYLLAHHDLTEEQADLAFGRSSAKPFSDSALRNRARRIWRAAGMSPIGFHESRHTYASFMIAAGVNAKALSSYMGHRSITTTLDRYGHLFPGNESEAAALLDAYLEGE